MNNTNNISNPYNDDKPSPMTFIGYDFDKEQTLYELIDKFKTSVSNAPIDSLITMYVVAMSDVEEPAIDNNIINEFTSYLHSTEYKIQVVFRGNITSSVIGLLLSFEGNVLIPRNTQWYYSSRQLNELLLHLEKRPEIFNLFLERWKTHYKFIEKSNLDLAELNLIGISFQTY